MSDKIKDYIKDKRDTLSKSSITTYASILKNLYLHLKIYSLAPHQMGGNKGQLDGGDHPTPTSGGQDLEKHSGKQ